MNTEHIVRILEINQVTHDVKSFRIEKPEHYTFVPGQATEVSVNKPGWETEKRPFTFTSLNEYPYLEFTIKRYADHNGVTNQIHQLVLGDELIIRDIWGTIEYNGPGYFIAGGAGITPFMAILRQLDKDHKLEGNNLFFSNKTTADIIYEQELKAMLGNDIINLITDEPQATKVASTHSDSTYRYQKIDEAFLKKEIPSFSVPFYVCGPDKMISDINEVLTRLGADPQRVVFEK
jgi:glycine betaine catabolism B